MTWTVLTVAAALVYAAALAAAVAGRIRFRTFCLLCAAANVCWLAAGAATGSTLFAGVSGAALAVALWGWWGGGTGIRRRLQAAARRWRGVRRTAPVGVGRSV